MSNKANNNKKKAGLKPCVVNPLMAGSNNRDKTSEKQQQTIEELKKVEIKHARIRIKNSHNAFIGNQKKLILEEFIMRNYL